MDEAEDDYGFGPGSGLPQMANTRSFVSLIQSRSVRSPSPCCRLASSFMCKPVSLCGRKQAWVDLQGRLVNAEEASSANAVMGGGGLSREEAMAWELFTPIQRFLLVAVIGVAAAESKKNRIISQLKSSVELRDHVLLNMQQKLDNLCEQLNYAKDKQSIMGNMPVNEKSEPPSGIFGIDKINFVDCGCWLCDHHHNQLTGLEGNSMVKNSNNDEVFPNPMSHANESEQEERRMSDWSDWASSSVTSAAEIQMNHFSIEQDIFNLRKECEEKDATIKELTSLIKSSNVTGSKRISELEDIIRRKNMVITRIKKDMLVLEQKVVQLTRQRRSSFSVFASTSALDSNCWQLPVLTDNVLYDMDSSTSPSSSDSDCPPKNQSAVLVAKYRDTPLQFKDPSSDLDCSPKNRAIVPVAKYEDTPLGTKNPCPSDLDCLSKNDDEDTPLGTKNPCPSDLDCLSKNDETVPVAKHEDSPVQILDTPLQNHKSASTSDQKSASPKVSSSLLKPTSRLTKSQPVNSSRDASRNQCSPLRQKQSFTRGEFKKTRRRTQTVLKEAALQKRWV